MASADWIALDILDSIVDSFFPFLENIETEAVATDNTIFSGTLESIIPTESPKPPKTVSIISGLTKSAEKSTDDHEFEDEKSQHSPRLRFVIPHLSVSLVFHRMKRFISNAWRTKVAPPPTPTPTPLHLTLRRIGSTKKLVTSLVRLLATKSDVLAAFRKQLMRATVLKHKSMAGRSSDELAIYCGDVQGWLLF
jgi:magnesium transporter